MTVEELLSFDSLMKAMPYSLVTKSAQLKKQEAERRSHSGLQLLSGSRGAALSSASPSKMLIWYLLIL